MARRLVTCVVVATFLWAHASIRAMRSQAGEPAVRVLSESQTMTRRASKDEQPIDAEARTLTIAIRPPADVGFLSVLMARDPESGLHWWTYRGANSATEKPLFRLGLRLKRVSSSA